MNSSPHEGRCAESPLVSEYSLGTLEPSEVPALETHIAACPECRQSLRAMNRIVDSFAHWPTDVLRPSPSLWAGVAGRIAAEAGTEPLPRGAREWKEPEWEEVAPGISCKLLATDPDGDRVSMLVRLAPGAEYPPHRHAGIEELHLLDGELWIDERKLYPGDYNSAAPGTSDERVWSETGCTCVLVTSSRDVLG